MLVRKISFRFYSNGMIGVNQCFSLFLEGGREWTIFVEEKKNIFTSSPPPRPFSKVGKDEKN